MKQFTLLTFFISLISVSAFSQTFEEGLELYQQQQYEDALEIFTALDDGRSLLFAGKSHFDLQNYLKANSYLEQASEASREVAYRQEADFTLGLSHFRMKNYSKSIDLLHELIISEERGRAKVDAQQFYRQLLQFFTLDQRFEIIQSTDYQAVAKDIVTSSYGTFNHLDYTALVNVFLERITDDEQRATIASELNRRARPGSDSLGAPALSTPDGMVYNVGVILPANDDPGPGMLVPRNLYYGITFAAEEFNSRYTDKKIALNYRNSHRDPDSTAKAFHNIVWKGFSDAVIGPLFSETASRMAGLSEQYMVPMIAPLANSDEINLDYNYTFQMNPTFEVHGKRMARYAVRQLGLDTLAVITPNEALGTASARSFRHEAERLGAFVSYYIEEDFSSLGYDLTDFTKVFTTDKTEIDSLNYIPTEGIYAPFTGQAANTLINLLMTDLEVLGSDMVILGSEEWQSANLSAWQERNFAIYYSQGFGEAADTSAVRIFEEDFQTRFGLEADQFSKLGYDIGTYLFESLSESGNPALLTQIIRNRDSYNGLAIRINMDGQRINQHVYIRALTPQAINGMSSE
ncbi:ABC transporter substrate-binding protein [Rhodohalobacter sp. 8-1]|uniref:ABC transporter substrate-binding protein n=1 Tax=Rhodohalobacter sp. 8-1 TaxID=3131972 RepID=UPI0030EB3698